MSVTKSIYGCQVATTNFHKFRKFCQKYFYESTLRVGFPAVNVGTEKSFRHTSHRRAPVLQSSPPAPRLRRAGKYSLFTQTLPLFIYFSNRYNITPTASLGLCNNPIISIFKSIIHSPPKRWRKFDKSLKYQNVYFIF